MSGEGKLRCDAGKNQEFWCLSEESSFLSGGHLVQKCLDLSRKSPLVKERWTEAFILTPFTHREKTTGGGARRSDEGE